jgi:glycosyltransferase involved in cell wall biosynthesis
MRLLILDESWQVTGGVDTVRRFLLPALAAQTEKLVWACSIERCLNRLENFDQSRMEIIDLHPPTQSRQGLAWAAMRRLPASWRPTRLQASLSHSYLRQYCRQHGLTHVLEICVHHEPFPGLHLPTFGIVHDLGFPDPTATPMRESFRGWLQHANGLITDSSMTRRQLLELDPSAGQRVKVLMLPATPLAKTPATQETNPWQRPEPVIFYPARATYHKGHDVLLAALAQLATENMPFHCYLSGIGTDLLFSDEASPERSINDVRLLCVPYREILRGRVTLLGRKPWPVIEQIYGAASFIAFPSRFEGFGLPLSEALSWGRPIIASQIDPLQEQVAFLQADEQVRWFPTGDAAALAERLKEVLTQNQPFPPFSSALRERLAAWDWDAYAHRVIELISETHFPA